MTLRTLADTKNKLEISSEWGPLIFLVECIHCINNRDSFGENGESVILYKSYTMYHVRISITSERLTLIFNYLYYTVSLCI